MPNISYKRGQVEWAIWRFFTLMRGIARDPPQVFLTRIKRLLETDRENRVPTGQDYPARSAFAFSSSRNAGQGVDAAFSSFDAFCLALALDLVDVGFKPSETVFLLRYLRADLSKQFQSIKNAPPPPMRKPEPANARRELPSYSFEGLDLADGRIFWVIQKVELKEIYAPPGRKQAKTSIPIFLEPTFCRGINELSQELGAMNTQRWGYRKALVLEIAYLAAGLDNLLAKAPLTKRGRS